MATEIANEYQPGFTLHFQINEDTLTATIVHAFTPFTYSQVVVVRTSHAYTVGRIRLPKDFLLVAKIYDVRFTKERNGTFSDRLGVQTEIPHPWSYELEACAARKRQGLSYLYAQQCPDRPDYEEEDQVLWENWIFHLAEVNFCDQVESYRLCKSLQGHGIPTYYASGTLDYSNFFTQRAVSTRVILLEYIPDARTIEDANSFSITPAIVRSLVTTVESFAPLGVIHGDLNYSNILISANPPRGTIIDFGIGGIRRSIAGEQWAEMVSIQDDAQRMLEFFDPS